eukprot:6448403-Alexandrium_andersonii.AAC.1
MHERMRLHRATCARPARLGIQAGVCVRIEMDYESGSAAGHVRWGGKDIHHHASMRAKSARPGLGLTDRVPGWGL